MQSRSEMLRRRIALMVSAAFPFCRPAAPPIQRFEPSWCIQAEGMILSFCRHTVHLPWRRCPNELREHRRSPSLPPAPSSPPAHVAAPRRHAAPAAGRRRFEPVSAPSIRSSALGPSRVTARVARRLLVHPAPFVNRPETLAPCVRKPFSCTEVIDSGSPTRRWIRFSLSLSGSPRGRPAN